MVSDDGLASLARGFFVEGAALASPLPSPGVLFLFFTVSDLVEETLALLASAFGTLVPFLIFFSDPAALAARSSLLAAVAAGSDPATLVAFIADLFLSPESIF
jgi:hypothetical protein